MISIAKIIQVIAQMKSISKSPFPIKIYTSTKFFHPRIPGSSRKKNPFLFLQEMGFDFSPRPYATLWVKGLWIRGSGISEGRIAEWGYLSRQKEDDELTQIKCYPKID